MPTPIEEGWFWYTPSDGPKRPQPMQVVRDAQGHLHIGAPTCGSPHPDRAAGTWGERIPDSPTLEAMRQVVRRDPMHTCNVTGARLCYYCGGNQGPDAPNPERRDHAHDCPWRRAQEPKTRSLPQ